MLTTLTNDLSIPDNIKELQTMVVELHKKLDEMEKNYELETRLLRERVNQLLQQIYGRKSEKFSLLLDDGFDQSLLFKEPQEAQEGNFRGAENSDDESEDEDNSITIAEHKRKKRGRKPLPDNFERVEIVHDLSAEEKQCGCGCEMSRIGEEVSEQLEMVPSQFWVIRHVRPKYACKNCEGVDGDEDESSVKIAPVPMQLIPKSICTPSLLSHILISKFCDSLPFYRQEKQFHRFDIVLSRGTMCTWAVKVAEKCKRLVELLHHAILSGPLINIDETTFQVLSEPDRRVDSKSYMWVFRGGPPGKVGVLYIYDESRSGSVASEFLGDFQGYVQTDGFSGYDFLDIREGIIHVGCWAHVRRKFFAVVKAFVDKGKGKGKGKGLGKAGEALQTIRDLYAIEKKARDMGLPPEMVYEERQQKSKPIVDKFKLWLEELAPTVPPKSLLGNAVNYTLGQWPRLIKYLDNGLLRMDNNLVENDIRPFVVGRKNWLFFGQPEGADAGAVLYSLIETAKANGLEPYHYLLYLFDKLPGLDVDSICDDQLRSLLPMNLTPEVLVDHKKEYLKARGQEGTLI
jgi:transposase